MEESNSKIQKKLLCVVWARVWVCVCVRVCVYICDIRLDILSGRHAPATSAGVSSLEVLPVPSCPFQLPPQHLTPPPVEITQAYQLPAVMATAERSGAGVCVFVYIYYNIIYIYLYIFIYVFMYILYTYNIKNTPGKEVVVSQINSHSCINS